MTTAFGSVPLLSESISDPSYQLSRLVCLDRDNILVGNSDELKMVNIQTSNPLELDEYLDSGNVSRCHSYSLNDVVSMKAIPPTRTKVSSMFQSVQIIHKSSQPQAVAVTSHGDLITCSLNKDLSKNIYSFGVPTYGTTSSGVMSSGYVGLCHTPERHVTCHYLSKSLVWSDMNTLDVTRQSALFGNPTCVAAATGAASDGSSVILTAEGPNIAVFDERQNSKGGCVFRENENSNSGGGVLWDILPLGDSNRVAAAGADKNIRIYDNRMWKTITKWRAPHKFDVVKLLPSSNNPLQLYVAGRDNEVLLCDLEPHLMSTQVQKVKSRKSAPPVPSVAVESNAQSDINPPLKKQKSNDTDVTKSGDVAVSAANTNSGPELLPMQLPTSSKLRISHHRGVRAEFMWAGLDVVLKNESENDRLVGVCGRGKLYVVDSANLMKLAI
jgi:WD40 repeat protein